jgi:RNA polymerase sigma-70 factor (ECF subfamily)
MSMRSLPASSRLRLVDDAAAPKEEPERSKRSLDDSELLAALRVEAPSATTALHDRVRPQVDCTLRRLLGPSDVDYQDIAQTALIEIVFTIGRYRGECSLDSWVSKVTAHVVYRHLRRRKTERRIFGLLTPEDVALPSSSRTGREITLRDLRDRVRAHLGQMDPNKAWTFFLHDVCGYDLREIAEITGVSVAAAQTRLVRGRREVHERIEADPELSDLLNDIEGRE